MNTPHKIVISSQDHLHLINQNEIVLCKSDDCYTLIHLMNGGKLMISKSLSKFSKELHQPMFVRISQSYLININFIKMVDKKRKHIELTDKQQLQFTRTIKDLLASISSNFADHI